VGRLDGSLAFYDTTSGQVIPAPPPAKPELASLSERGVQAGTTRRITLSGKHLAEVTGVKSNHDKLAVSLAAVHDGDRVEVDVTPAADLPRGQFELWLVNAGGESNRQPIYVDNLPQVAEVEPNNVSSAANPMALESDVWGTLSTRGDVDRFAFDAKAGQNIVFEVAAAEFDSKANVVLTVFDDHGRVLADNNDFAGTADPLLPFIAPAEGRYIVEVRDLMLAGSGEHFYRLALGQFAVVTGVYPLSVPANAETEVEPRPPARSTCHCLPKRIAARGCSRSWSAVCPSCWRPNRTTRPNLPPSCKSRRQSAEDSAVRMPTPKTRITFASKARPARRGSSRLTPLAAARRRIP
jgi:hypothetical protein